MKLGRTAILIMIFVLPVATLFGQTNDSRRALTIKAGIVLNFIRYTAWPDSAFETSESPIVLTVVGSDDVQADLEQTIQGQRVHDRPIEIRRVSFPEPIHTDAQAAADRMSEFYAQLRSSHVLFIGDTEDARLEAILQAVDAADVLTVGDLDRFAERGGMLGLTTRRDRIAFDANSRKIEQSNIKVSSQLLRLARIVK